MFIIDWYNVLKIQNKVTQHIVIQPHIRARKDN